MTDQVCPHRAAPCRHAGYNFQVVKRERTKKIGSIEIPDGIETVMEDSGNGLFCNDLQKYTSAIKSCPHHPQARAGACEIKIIEGAIHYGKSKQTVLEWLP